MKHIRQFCSTDSVRAFVAIWWEKRKGCNLVSSSNNSTLSCVQVQLWKGFNSGRELPQQGRAACYLVGAVGRLGDLKILETSQ